LYSGIAGGTIELVSTVSLLGTAGVNPRGSSLDWINNLLVASDTGQSIMTVFAAPPYEEWFDFTLDHGTDDGVNAIFAI
jgi:hypothetical protein